ncbi:hypothetical protein QWZ16_24100 [Vibrio ostreicida]|uniref:DUF3265 domain-containing protein n=1 Tax=Vibrio ostreicida TaxID=526588 RepID=A0ABT8BZW1_9VIBR|nr:hypothetical protein [Vibrio ostreicida]MDN3612671.1 hypothetical protein [Vibrio ostreicida]
MAVYLILLSIIDRWRLFASAHRAMMAFFIGAYNRVLLLPQ